MKLSLCVLLIFGLSAVAVAASESTYSGKELRKIKSLSQDEIDGYLAGKGMGFAKSAELNHFPGPKHVLELAADLGLSKDQKKQTQKIYEAMEGKAVEYGKLLVRSEKEIEKLFAEGTVNFDTLENALNKSATIRSKLRGVHLVAHIEQKAILSKHQVMLYDTLRGYAGGHSIQGHQHHHQ